MSNNHLDQVEVLNIGPANYATQFDVDISKKVNKKLKLCPNQKCSPDNNKDPKPIGLLKDDEALYWECQKCGIRWLTCTQCRKQRKHILELKRYDIHVNNCHQENKKRKAPDDDSTIRDDTTAIPQGSGHADDSANTVWASYDSNDDPMDLESSLPAIDYRKNNIFDTNRDIVWHECTNDNNAVRLGFNDEKSQRYFKEQYLLSDGSDSGGMNYLVTRALKDNEYHPSASIQEEFKVPLKLAVFNMKLAKLAYSLTPGTNELLGALLSGGYLMGLRDGYETCTNMIDASFQDWSRRNCDHTSRIRSQLISDKFIKGTVAEPFCEEQVKPRSYTWRDSIPWEQNIIRHRFMEGRNALIPNLPCLPFYQGRCPAPLLCFD